MRLQVDKTGNEKPPLIEYRNVTVRQNNHLMLDGINLTIDQGEHVAILGPNGAGKSSFIKTITREYYPHAGVADSYMRILGKEYWNVFELRTRLGVVSSDLVSMCTGNYSGRRIMLSGFFSSIGIWPHHKVTPAMEQKVDEVMELLEIQHLADRLTNQISTGEARRILIGRALVHDPETLVLDEPSSSLDLHATYELRKILRKIAIEGTSIVMVTHHLADIIPEITRVITLKAGRVFEDGPKEELLTSASLSRLFGSSFEVLKRDGYYYLW